MIKMWYSYASLMREGQETPSYCMWRVVMLHLQLKFLMVRGGGRGVSVGVGVGAAIGGARAGGGGGAGAAIKGDGLEEEFDWLNEGLEGEDFADDIFGD